MKPIERKRRVETLKEDVTKLRDTAGLIDKARSRVSFISDGELHGLIDEALDVAWAFCTDSAQAKIARVRELSLAEMGEESGTLDGNKGTRRLKR